MWRKKEEEEGGSERRKISIQKRRRIKKKFFPFFIAQPSGQWPSLSLQPQKFVNCERVSYNLVDTLADTRI